MGKPKLYYFDAPASRGEECRLAMTVGGFEFEDVRLSREQWAQKKPTTPFGSVPVLEIDGKPPLAQSNAILVYVGRKSGLHPTDDFEAARHEAMMAYVEDLRIRVALTLAMDDAEKKKTREALAASYIPTWAANADRQVSDDGPFFGGAKIHVVDFKIHMIVKWIASNKLDHLPGSLLASATKLHRVHDAVRDHAKVKEWYARK